jgi:hypothetical protein
LTKQAPDEAVLKCHGTVEEVTTVNEGVTDMLEKNALAICGASFSPVNSIETEHPSEPRIRHVGTKMRSFKSRLERIMHKLYDLEPDHGSEKPLTVDLGVNLYQMEDY